MCFDLRSVFEERISGHDCLKVGIPKERLKGQKAKAEYKCFYREAIFKKNNVRLKWLVSEVEPLHFRPLGRQEVNGLTEKLFHDL